MDICGLCYTPDQTLVLPSKKKSRKLGDFKPDLPREEYKKNKSLSFPIQTSPK